MKSKKRPTFKQDQAEFFQDDRHNPYQNNQKFTDPTICRKCGALYKNGRWSWDDLPNNAEEDICPACLRIADNYPAGYIEIKGSFFEQHEKEILNLIHKIALIEQFQNPLERIIKIDPVEDHTLITTTGINLARLIGDALKRSYRGQLHYTNSGENYIHVWWHR
jgi:NMD protein affecting ribosome stability and mRNA decay